LYASDDLAVIVPTLDRKEFERLFISIWNNIGLDFAVVLHAAPEVSKGVAI